MKANEILAKH